MSLPVEHSDEICSERRYERRPPFTFRHIFVIKGRQRRVIFVKVQRGQKVLQTYNVAKVEYTIRLVRVSVLLQLPEMSMHGRSYREPTACQPIALHRHGDSVPSGIEISREVKPREKEITESDSSCLAKAGSLAAH